MPYLLLQARTLTSFMLRDTRVEITTTCREKMFLLSKSTNIGPSPVEGARKPAPAEQINNSARPNGWSRKSWLRLLGQFLRCNKRESRTTQRPDPAITLGSNGGRSLTQDVPWKYNGLMTHPIPKSGKRCVAVDIYVIQLYQFVGSVCGMWLSLAHAISLEFLRPSVT